MSGRAKSVKRFERSIELDTALYINYLFLTTFYKSMFLNLLISCAIFEVLFQVFIFLTIFQCFERDLMSI